MGAGGPPFSARPPFSPVPPRLEPDEFVAPGLARSEKNVETREISSADGVSSRSLVYS